MNINMRCSLGFESGVGRARRREEREERREEREEREGGGGGRARGRSLLRGRCGCSGGG
jgi:hypothetical protein